jgi:hypothetical protein
MAGHAPLEVPREAPVHLPHFGLADGAYSSLNDATALE